MGRNNERNIKIHNDKLHKAQDKVKQAAMDRKAKLKLIAKKFNTSKDSEKEQSIWKIVNLQNLKTEFKKSLI